tara:strand:- start:88 stop:750 length:663 start_codon:yes stop_codon:yes gene_type:complete
MATNPYINQRVNSEQNLTEDLTIETIKAMGRDMLYIPRTLVNLDTIFGEDELNKFENAFPLEMYIESIQGFEGPGDIISQIGLDIKDRVNLRVSRKRFEQEVTAAIPSIGRPKEGDLVHFPLSNTTFEINFVEHENPFYQLGRLYTYQLQCEVFTYSNETIDTGNSIIDKLEDDRKGLSGDLVIPTDPSGITAGDNDEMHNLSRSILDFSEKDPFSEGRY